MHVLLFGFTSSIGLLALPHLRSSGHTLTAYVRSPDKLEGFDGLEIVHGELDEGDKIRGLFEGATPVGAIRSVPFPSLKYL
jgi:putative NADH-flavin reductase